MSRTWTRATVVRLCGGCGHELAVGDPVLELRLMGVHDPKLRCVLCEGPAPPDLAPLVERERMDERPMVHIRSGAHVLPFDFKKASAGDIGEND